MVVIPAHDEQSGIAATVRSCLSLDIPQGLFEVLVIADNCSDDTASIARQQGARSSNGRIRDKKSKGHAIKFLIDRLHESGRFAELDAIVVIDADTTVSSDLLLVFAGSIEAGEDWIQCFYSVANPDASWRTRLMAYAFSLFNGVTPLGQSVLGLSAGFHGNGMCFSTRSLHACRGGVSGSLRTWNTPGTCGSREGRSPSAATFGFWGSCWVRVASRLSHNDGAGNSVAANSAGAFWSPA